MKNLLKITALFVSSLGLTSCAIGSGVAGASTYSVYSSNAGEASRLSENGEAVLKMRIKEEIVQEYGLKNG